MTPLEDVLERAHRLGFLGPGPIDPHVDHARAFARALTIPPVRAADLGSGGGIPALVLALGWPDSRWTLIESRERRAVFLGEALSELGLAGRAEVLHRRAEDVGADPEHRGGYDLVTARSFGPPATTAECAAGLLRVGGTLLVSEPPEPRLNRWPKGPLARLGLVPTRTIEGPPRLQVLRQDAPCADEFPRRSGRSKRQPLWRQG